MKEFLIRFILVSAIVGSAYVLQRWDHVQYDLQEGLPGYWYELIGKESQSCRSARDVPAYARYVGRVTTLDRLAGPPWEPLYFTKEQTRMARFHPFWDDIRNPRRTDCQVLERVLDRAEYARGLIRFEMARQELRELLQMDLDRDRGPLLFPDRAHELLGYHPNPLYLVVFEETGVSDALYEDGK